MRCTASKSRMPVTSQTVITLASAPSTWAAGRGGQGGAGQWGGYAGWGCGMPAQPPTQLAIQARLREPAAAQPSFRQPRPAPHLNAVVAVRKVLLAAPLGPVGRQRRHRKAAHVGQQVRGVGDDGEGVRVEAAHHLRRAQAGARAAERARTAQPPPPAHATSTQVKHAQQRGRTSMIMKIKASPNASISLRCICAAGAAGADGMVGAGLSKRRSTAARRQQRCPACLTRLCARLSSSLAPPASWQMLTLRGKVAARGQAGRQRRVGRARGGKPSQAEAVPTAAATQTHACDSRSWARCPLLQSPGTCWAAQRPAARLQRRAGASCAPPARLLASLRRRHAPWCRPGAPGTAGNAEGRPPPARCLHRAQNRRPQKSQAPP